jgi:glycosyltransferase involved in cell wall biosynthesis
LILFYLPDLRVGGAERVIINLIKHCHHHSDLPIALLLGKREGPLLDQIPPNIPVYTLNSNSAKTSVIPLVKFCHQHKPDVVFASLGASLAIALAKPFIPKSIKVINRLGNTIGAEKLLFKSNLKRLFYIYANKLIGKMSDCLIFQCNYMADDYMRETGVKLQDHAVIYNPVDIQKIEKLATESINIKYDMIAVGRLDPQKDYPTLITACNILKERGAKFSLAILGDGRLRDQLADQIKAYDLDGSVFLLGHVKNPYPYIAGSSYLVSSSLYEGFSNVLIEALSLGTPVIATDCPGGNKETIAVNNNGYLCTTSDAISIADTIELALKERGKFNKEQIKNNAFAKYNLKKIGDTYQNVITNIFKSARI